MSGKYQRITNNTPLLTVIIAILYLLTAKLGFMLAVEPGNVTAIWPPSGIALAAALLFGWRAAIGIWLGSFIVNAWVMTGPLSLHTASGIAAGSLLQALITAQILAFKHDRKQFYLPSTPRVILGFIFLTGITTFIAPTIGVTSLWAGGRLGDLPLNLFVEPFNSLWWTWWIGDYAGILVVAPICLRTLAPENYRQQGHDSWLLPISSALMGLTLINFFFVLQGYIDDYQRKLDQDAKILKIHIEDRLNKQLYRLNNLNAFFASSEKVTQEEFNTFASNIFDSTSLTKTLEWVPAVREENKIAFEKEARKNISGNYTIFEKDAAHNNIPAHQRPWYFPILYAVPIEENKSVLGYDLGSDLIRLSALHMARDSGQPTATGKIRLVQTKPDIDDPTILLARPLYKDNVLPKTVEERRNNLLGFSIGLMPIKTLLPKSIAMAGLGEMLVEIYDITAAEQPRLLDSNYDIELEKNKNNVAPFVSKFSINFANRNWEFFVRLPRTKMRELHPAAIWLVLIAGIATTLIIVMYAHGRRVREEMLLKSELETRQLIEANPEGILVIDDQGLIVRSNKQIQLLFGYNAIDLLGQPIKLLLPEDLDNTLPQSYCGMMDGHNEFIGRHQNGNHIPVDAQFSSVNIKDSPLTMVVIQDISAQKNQEQAIRDLNTSLEQRVIERTTELVEEINTRQRTELELRNSQKEQTQLIRELQFRNVSDQRLALLLQELQTSANTDEALQKMTTGLKDLMPGTQGAILIEIQPGQWHTVVQWSMTNEEYYPDTIVFEHCYCQTQQQSYYHYNNIIHNCTISQILQHTKCEPPNINFFCSPQKTASGASAIVHIAGTENRTEDEIKGRRERATDIINQIWLVMANMQLRDILQSQALRDGLTGLYNRRFLNDILEKEVSRSLRNSIPLAIAIIDIDFFKRINDAHGHTIGDHILKYIANHLQEHVRSSDYACRYGGEEFVLLLHDCLPEQAMERMETLRKKIASTHIAINEHHIDVTISVGIAHCPEHGQTALDLLENADKALYRAKQNGRNQVISF